MTDTNVDADVIDTRADVADMIEHFHLPTPEQTIAIVISPTPEQIRRNRLAWSHELRRPEWQNHQTTGSLADSDGVCCLGLALCQSDTSGISDLWDDKTIKINLLDGEVAETAMFYAPALLFGKTGRIETVPSDSSLTDVVYQSLGMESLNEMDLFISLNDDERLAFSQIGDIVERWADGDPLTDAIRSVLPGFDDEEIGEDE